MRLSLAQAVMSVGLIVIALAVLLAFALSSPQPAKAQGACPSLVKDCTLLSCGGRLCTYSCVEYSYQLIPDRRGYAGVCAIASYRTYTERRFRW
jgi:hypothetical protein